MTICSQALMGGLLMGLGAWLANMLPALPRRGLIWAGLWGVAAGTVVLVAGLQPMHAVWIMVAAVLGGIVPAGPAEIIQPGNVTRDMGALLLLGALRLLPMAVVLWACDLYWPKMLEAAGLILPSYLAGSCCAARWTRWPGLRSAADFGAVYFALGLGALLALTPMLPPHPVWPARPAELNFAP